MAEFKPFEGERQELQQRGVTEAAAWLCSNCLPSALSAGVISITLELQFLDDSMFKQ